MKKLLLTLISGLIITFSACKKDSKNNGKAKSKIEGIWIGTYSGGDEGSIIVNIDGNGKINGTSTSSKTLEKSSLIGKVGTKGEFMGVTEIGMYLLGTFNQSSVNGTWKNSRIDSIGTWICHKK